MTQDGFLNEEIEEHKQASAKLKKLIKLKSNTMGEYKVEIALKTGFNNPHFLSHQRIKEQMCRKLEARKTKSL